MRRQLIFTFEVHDIVKTRRMPFIPTTLLLLGTKVYISSSVAMDDAMVYVWNGQLRSLPRQSFGLKEAQYFFLSS